MQTVKVREIKLTDYLKEKYIVLNLKGRNKKEILTELTDVLALSGKIKNKKAILKVLLERERLGSTGIGNGVAIPHSKSEHVKDFVLAFARKEGGIDFGALDGEKTHIFFILASPKDEVGGHLKIIAKVSRLINDKFVVESLKKATTKGQILKMVSMYGK